MSYIGRGFSFIAIDKTLLSCTIYTYAMKDSVVRFHLISEKAISHPYADKHGL